MAGMAAQLRRLITQFKVSGREEEGGYELDEEEVIRELPKPQEAEEEYGIREKTEEPAVEG